VVLAGARWSVLHVPGHSPGSICLYGHGVLIGGDVLFQGSIGRTDLPGGDGPLLLTGIREKLLVLPDETVVYPGHGPATTIGRERAYNPFLT
jgi:glyoxylase-like metal-dependent hydrolase (beta-lactamase superfamily II)